tara:strand:+ start:1933 stop:2205 length:273 start_codon:yes stop_codon:yes gene_type:complete
MAIMPHYIPWLFDDQIAWQTAVSDPRYNYMMPFPNFVALYQEHRTGQVAQFNTSAEAVDDSQAAGSESGGGEAGQILDQSEIDNLIDAMG